jgi:hypothetical protein
MKKLSTFVKYWVRAAGFIPGPQESIKKLCIFADTLIEKMDSVANK